MPEAILYFLSGKLLVLLDPEPEECFEGNSKAKIAIVETEFSSIYKTNQTATKPI
jgi:hypothetical protein